MAGRERLEERRLSGRSEADEGDVQGGASRERASECEVILAGEAVRVREWLRQSALRVLTPAALAFER
jgi:hypothetical protein